MSIKRTQEFINKLQTKLPNIIITPYKRGPLGKHNFSIAKDNNKGLKVWVPENAQYTLRTNKKYNQFVLTVTEPSRKVPNRMEKYIYLKLRNEIYSQLIKIKNREDVSKIKLPTGSIITIKDLLAQNESTTNFIPNSRFVFDGGAVYHTSGHIVYTGYSRVRKTTTTFLCGTDEDKHFICVLKNPVSSVQEAHQELRPKGLSNKAKRHGEWFLDPVSDTFHNQLLKSIDKIQKNEPLEGATTRFGRSSHKGNIIQIKRDKFVIGTVKDTRKGYHKPIILNRFHKLVRNNEVKINPTVRNYD